MSSLKYILEQVNSKLGHQHTRWSGELCFVLLCRCSGKVQEVENVVISLLIIIGTSKIKVTVVKTLSYSYPYCAL